MYKVLRFFEEQNKGLQYKLVLGVDIFEKISINLLQVGGNSQDILGATISIINNDTQDIIQTFTWQGETIETSIFPYISYKIQLSPITGYLTPSTRNYLSEPTAVRQITMYYNSELGIYIEATDEIVYNDLDWKFSGKTANAVVVLTSACKVRMALTEITLPIHTNNSDPLQNYIMEKDEASAKVDYDGEGNTNKIIQFNTAYGSNTTSYAAPYCKAYTFTYPSGQKGCLPSLGQLWTLYQNRTEVDACLSACGGTVLNNASVLK